MSTPDFPIPYPHQSPYDDILHVGQLIEVLSWTFDNGLRDGISKNAVSDLYAVLTEVRSGLEPITRFLANLEYPELLNEYRMARREAVLQTWEKR
jgi:hypothetical protein